MLPVLALKDPGRGAAGAVSRVGVRGAVVDVRGGRMERHPALARPLAARDFGAAEAPAAVDPNALRAEAHRRLDRALHGAPESDAAHELLGDVLRDELGVDLRLADLDDVQRNLRTRHLAQVLPHLLDVGALLADDDTRPRRMDGDARLLRRPLDDHLRDARLGEDRTSVV